MVDFSVVRLGPSQDNVSATLLRTALVSHFQNQKDATIAANGATTKDETDDIHDKTGSTLTVSNKYFTANVILESIGSPSVAAAAAASTAGMGKEDGVILVFDALQSNPDRPSGSGTTFDSLELAHNETEDKDGAGDLLRLCVGVSLTSLSSPEELRGQNADREYSRRILWCLDRGYEYIEADLSRDGQMKGHNERDKEGFARIVEAIEGTVWSSAVMSKTKTKELKDCYQDDRKKALHEEENKTASDVIDKEEEKNPYEPPDSSSFGAFSATSANGIANADAPLTKESELVLDPESLDPEEIANTRKEQEVDQLFEKMEGVLREASRIRDASKAGEMTDDERRDRAGDAAMALVNLMSQFGLDDDDSQVEDSSDDENS